MYQRLRLSEMIQCANPRAQYLAHQEEINDAIHRVLNSGWYILGKEVKAFEEEFAAYIDSKYGVGVGSGTEALRLALAAFGVGDGDEVITVSHTAVATVTAIELSGATPVIVDIQPDYFTIDPSLIEQAITPKIKAIIPVHIYGQPADMDLIMGIAREHGLKVIEDCAQAHGSIYKGRRAGSIGDMSCFSFYPTKNLGAIGDGGIVITKAPALLEKLRLLREYGWKERYVSHTRGWNTRLDEIQAAVLRVKLKYLDSANARRNIIADTYTTGLKDCSLILPKLMDGNEHVYHQYVIRTDKRDELLSFLKSKDICALIHYPVPVHMQPAYTDIHHNGVKQTEKAAKEILSLPIYPELSLDAVGNVIDAIKEFYS